MPTKPSVDVLILERLLGEVHKPIEEPYEPYRIALSDSVGLVLADKYLYKRYEELVTAVKNYYFRLLVERKLDALTGTHYLVKLLEE